MLRPIEANLEKPTPANDTGGSKALHDKLIHRKPWAEWVERMPGAIPMGGKSVEVDECKRYDLLYGLCDACMGDTVARELVGWVKQWNLPRL